MSESGKTWLCVNEDGQYVVFRLHDREFLDYQEHDGNYEWRKIYYDSNGVVITKDDTGVPIHERYFATNIQGLDPGDKIMLKS